MQIFDDSGITIKEESEFRVDSRRGSGRNVLITHAHSDHAPGNSRNSYHMTKETASLIRKGKEKKLDIGEHEFGKKFNLGEFCISFCSSGHLLGGSQIKIEGSKEVVFTSDFNLQKDLLFPEAEILPSEVLIIESTFGLPEFKFPERERVYEAMAAWVKHNLGMNKFVLLGGYSLGKAQELTAFVNEYVGETPIVHPNAFRNNLIYEEHNVKLGNYLPMENLKDGNILIVPPYFIQRDLVSALEYTLRKKVACAAATGWKIRGGFVKGFPLSGHADFEQLMAYVKQSEPKLVLTHHGFAREFANSVQRRLGIAASELGSAGQRTIAEFSI